MTNQKTSLKLRYGPWALVTGATDGIGRAFAMQLAEAGFSLVLAARRGARLDSIAKEITQAHGVDCRAYPVDLGDLAATERLIAATADIDVGLLVAAAGFGSSGSFLERDPMSELEMVDVNCSSVLLQCYRFGQRFRARGRGGVVLMSSLLAFQGTPGSANYAATKAYVQSLGEALRVEWSAHHIDVIASAPGPVDTGFARRADMLLSRSTTPEVVARATLAALARKTTVRPGALSKLLGWSLGTAPRLLRVRIMGNVMAGMTAHQRPARSS
jgi:short-subunit dehydrogenase